MISRSLKRNGWHVSDMILAGVLVAIGIAATWPVWSDIYRIATYSYEHSHIFLVPFVAFWLVWVRRFRLHGCGRTGAIFGPIVLLAGIGCMILGPKYDFEALVHFGALLLVLGCLISVVGAEPVKLFFPAFFVLIFLVPVPGFVRHSLVAPLDTVAISTATALLDVMGVTIRQNGELIVINGEALAVTRLVEGTIMVFSVVLLSMAFAFGMPLRPMVRFIVIAASPLAVIVLNVARMVPCVWMYGYADPFVAYIVHVVSGWVVMTIAFLLLLGIIRVMRRAHMPVTRFTLAYD